MVAQSGARNGPRVQPAAAMAAATRSQSARKDEMAPRSRPQSDEHPFLPAGLSLDQYEQEIIREALRRADGNKSQAARLLGLTRNALRYRLTQMGMEA